jgi:primase-polymerase (primpol)-like protein
MIATEKIDAFALLPLQMRDARRWLVWKYLPVDKPGGKPRKVPCYIDGTLRRGELDGAEDVAHLGTFDDAVRALRRGDYAGLGFALGPDGTGNHWQGIDLD